MAVIKLGSLISDIKGSIGGVTFSRNASAITAKNKIGQKLSKTNKQLASINSNKAAVIAWQSLSVTNREVWNEYAKIYTKVDRYGNSKSLTGFNWFCSLFDSFQYMGLPYLTLPPSHTLPLSLPTFSVSINSSDIIIQWSEIINTSEVDVVIYSTGFVKSTSKFNRSAYRFTSKSDVDYSTQFSIKEGWEQAHNIILSNVSTGIIASISVMIFAVSKSSGISGVAQTYNSAFAVTGIGEMRIGSSFIVG